MSWFRWCRTPITEKAEFLDLPEFLINENDLTKQCIPVYKGFFGPDDDFNNLTGLEFVFSEHFYFTSFTKSEDGNARTMNEEGLNNLVASLYRPKKRWYNRKKNPDGDPRKPFNENLAMYYAKKVVNKWPMPVKLAIFTWYECCRQKMIESNPDIFSGGSAEPARHGLISVMRVIAESGIHGDFEKVTKMFVKMWMIELNEKADEAKRMEESAKP